MSADVWCPDHLVCHWLVQVWCNINYNQSQFITISFDLQIDINLYQGEATKLKPYLQQLSCYFLSSLQRH